MPHDTIIFLCNSTSEALLAAAQLPRDKELARFFIFLKESPDDNSIEWIIPPDHWLLLENSYDWTESVEALSIRAGLAYTSGWNLIFCWAKNPPSTSEIEKARLSCDSSNMVFTGDRLWGYSREYLVRFGIPGTASSDINKTLHHSPSDKHSLAKALRGLPVDDITLVEAIKECAVLKSLKVERSNIISPPCGALSLLLVTELNDLISDDGRTLLLCGNFPPEEVEARLLDIPRDGCLILITDTVFQDFVSNLIPYRKLFNTSGTCVFLFRATRK